MTTIENYLSQFTQPVQDMAFKLRAVVQETIPDANEWFDTHYQAIRYSVREQMNDTIVYIAAFKDSVNLGFYKGTSLPDPNKLLRGTGKNLRHVKFKAGDTIDSAGLRTLIAAAWAEDQKPS
jgi:hypothetical protein